MDFIGEFIMGRSIHVINAVAVKGDELYCVYKKYNFLLKINLKSWKYEKIAILEWKQDYLSADVYEIDGKIVCVPLRGVQAAIYNPESGEIKYRSAGDRETELIGSMADDHKIWFFPRNLPGKLFYYSLPEQTFSEDHMWKKELEKIGLYGRIKKKYFIDNKEIFIVFEKKIVKYDLENHFLEEISIPVSGHYIDIVRIGKTYYCLIEEEKRKVFYWDAEDKQVGMIEGTGDENYIKLTRFEDAIFLDTENSIDILRNGTIRRLDFSNNIYAPSTKFLNGIKYNNKWLLLPWGSTVFIECSLDFLNITKHKIEISMGDVLRNESCLMESEYSINDYIDGILHMDEILVQKKKMVKNGEAVYASVKE